MFPKLPPFSASDVFCTVRHTLLLLLVLSLTACNGDKKIEAGQSLVKVNGEDITVHQLNEELGRIAPAANQAAQDAASKQMLESLIDRQLLQNEAIASKVDRDPKVMQAIERAKAQILAQAYLQTRAAKAARPTKAEIDEYFQAHPDYFSQRKSFDMRQLILATKDFSEALRTTIDNAKSLDDVATWLDNNKIMYVRSQMTRTTADLPAPMAAKMQTMQKGQLFVVKENERSLIVGLGDVTASPVSAEVAAPQIEQYLRNQKSQQAAKDELARLRSMAKLDYASKPAAGNDKVAATPGSSATPASSTSSDSPAPPAADAGNMARGVAGLK